MCVRYAAGTSAVVRRSRVLEAGGCCRGVCRVVVSCMDMVLWHNYFLPLACSTLLPRAVIRGQLHRGARTQCIVRLVSQARRRRRGALADGRRRPLLGQFCWRWRWRQEVEVPWICTTDSTECRWPTADQCSALLCALDDSCAGMQKHVFRTSLLYAAIEWCSDARSLRALRVAAHAAGLVPLLAANLLRVNQTTRLSALLYATGD